MLSTRCSTSALNTRYQRILFVFPPTGTYCREDRCQSFFRLDLVPQMRPPLEECEAAGALRALGVASHLIDAPALQWDAERTLAEVLAWRADLVVVTTTFGSQDDDLAWLAELRTRAPSLDTCVRGAPVYTQARDLLLHPARPTFCVKGDYELVFDAVARHGWLGAPGAVYLSEGSVVDGGAPIAANLDHLPRPDRTIITPSLYRVRGGPRPQATVHVQRGCPFPCSFCLVATVSGKQARHPSPERVASEIAELWDAGYRYFYLRAETFTLNRKWALATCEAIRARCPGARWVTATRIDTTDEESLRAMAAAGCYGISFGVETGSEYIGRHIRKVPDAEQTRRVFRACDRLGILSLMYVMVGFLWETRSTLTETSDFVRRVDPDLLTVYFAHPYPGTTYYNEVREAGVLPNPTRAQAEAAFRPEQLERREVERFARTLIASHYTRPRTVIRLATKAGPTLARMLLA